MIISVCGNNFKIEKMPVFVPKARYEEIVAAFVNKLKKYDDILAVYQIGSINTPGISDVDLLIVLKDKAAIDPRLLSIKSLNEEEKYVFMHEARILNVSALRHLNYRFNVESLKKIYDKYHLNLTLDEYLDDNEFQKVSIIIDYSMDLIERFISLITVKKVYVRPMLCLLLSLRHTIIVFNSMGIGDVEGSDDYIENVVNLRNRCFELTIEELVNQMVTYAYKAVDIIMDIISILHSEKLNGADYFQGLIEKNKSVDNKAVMSFEGNTYFVFENNFDKQTAKEKTFKYSYNSTSLFNLDKLRNKKTVFLPISLFYHYNAYASGAGIISTNIETLLNTRFFNMEECCQTPYCEFLRKKVFFANEHAEFLINSGFFYGQLILNNFLEIPQKSIKSKIINFYNMKQLSVA